MYPARRGGFGRGPVAFLARTNGRAATLFDYSEGIFEDLNKFIQLSYYSGLYPDAADAVRAYVKYEFCRDDAELVDAVIRTETGLARRRVKTEESMRYPIANTSDVEYVKDIFEKYNRLLPEKIRTGYRFRLLYLRSVIDYELMTHDFIRCSPQCQEAMSEVIGFTTLPKRPLSASARLSVNNFAKSKINNEKEKGHENC